MIASRHLPRRVTSAGSSYSESEAYDRKGAARGGARQDRPALTARLIHQHIASMIDPLVYPAEPTAAAAIEAIGEELDLFDDWMERYEFIIEMGRKLPRLSRGVGRTTLIACLAARAASGWRPFRAKERSISPEHRTRRSSLAWWRSCCASTLVGRPPKSWPRTQIFLKDLGLLEALSTNRGNGIASMARKVREAAACLKYVDAAIRQGSADQNDGGRDRD